MSRIVGIIPAKSRSEGIPGKNAKALAGFPLVVWSVVPAREACDVVILTSDDPDIFTPALKEWADTRLVVHRRSPMLATARTPDLPVILDAYRQIHQDPDDVIVLLRPTAPFRRAEEIGDVVTQLRIYGADSVRSVSVAPDVQKLYLEATWHNWRWLVPATSEHRANHPRQGLRTSWQACGFIDAVRADVLVGWNSLEGDQILGWPAPPERAIDLDDEAHFRQAEEIATRHGWKPGEIT